MSVGLDSASQGVESENVRKLETQIAEWAVQKEGLQVNRLFEGHNSEVASGAAN